LFFYPDHWDPHEKRKQAGLIEGVIEFLRVFSNENDDYNEHPVETINTSLFTVWVKEVEKDMFLTLILSHENLYTDNYFEHSKETISNFTPFSSLFREEDSPIFKNTLMLYYDLFKLFHHSIWPIFKKDRNLLSKILLDFSSNFDKFIFHSDWGKTYFNNCTYRGFNICPLDSKTYLYVQKYVASMEIPRAVVFYKEYFVYSDIPQEEVELIKSYVIGPFSEARDGYVENWMDYGMRGDTTKVLRKTGSHRPSFSQSDCEEEKFNGEVPFADADYERFFDDQERHSDFWRVNTEGFKGENAEKSGFILGPSVFRQANKNDPEDMKTYELFAPRVFIRDSAHHNIKKPYQMVILKFNKMTFVYFLESAELEEYEYTLLYERTNAAASNLVKKIDPVIEYYNENYLRSDSGVKFFYFNEANLAVKYSPSIPIGMFNTELRHFLNIIKEKFNENELLEEYKITTSAFWMIGIKSLWRMIVIMLPLSLSLESMEEEKTRIVNRYFAQFII
jgi:hypothetical protein